LAGLVEACLKPRILILVVFVLPGCAAHTPASAPKRAQGIYHVVRPGENLFRIGKAYGVNYNRLARLNRIKNASQIRVGQKIFIPGATRRLPVEIITPSEPAVSVLHLPPAVDPAVGRFFLPVHGTVNSGFGPRGASFHDGVDIGAPMGTPIRAIESGEVIYSDHLRGYGNIVIIRHADGLVSVYAHNESNLVREGQTVARGEIIGRVGSTGRVTGPHLHFEIRKNNIAQDPLRYLPQLCCSRGQIWSPRKVRK
jgi:murein DD-endopeptidase MepM/ murein hydrolase activator NlpD